MRLINADALRAEWVDTVGEYTGREVVNSIDDMPTVTLEMSAVEYERARGRFVRWCDLRKCEWCEWKLNCRDLSELSSLSPEERVEFFMKWAKENPEEVGG